MKSKARAKSKKERNLKLEGMSIKLRLILTIVPIVAVMLMVITAATSLVSRSIIVERSNNEMAATLGEYSNYVAGEMDEVKAQADTLARFVAATYKSTTIDELGDAITTIVTNSDMVLGSGLWFEPNVYDSSEQYFGPYWCKNTDSAGKWDGGPLSLMWDYSNADYDYFSQEYYLNAKKITSAAITDPYYSS